MTTITANTNVAAYLFAKIAEARKNGADWECVEGIIRIDCEPTLGEYAAKIMAKLAIKRYQDQAA